MVDIILRVLFAAVIPHVMQPRAPMRTATRSPVVTPRVMPAKTKIMSILDRARVAMEESYGYEDPYEPAERYPERGGGGGSYSSAHTTYTTVPYEEEYETHEYYREPETYAGEKHFSNTSNSCRGSTWTAKSSPKQFVSRVKSWLSLISFIFSKKPQKNVRTKNRHFYFLCGLQKSPFFILGYA